VNVVDLMALFPPDVHPHGLPLESFVELFTEAQPVVFAFHGYQRAIHQLIHGRPNTGRFHVRGYNEFGTTTTPFDMVVLNEMSRYHLCLLACSLFPEKTAALQTLCEDKLQTHRRYIREHFEDMPEVRDFVWTKP
jgi:xylulose-5-phosphate/fructose-6-phosphate phosphoketolase